MSEANKEVIELTHEGEVVDSEVVKLQDKETIRPYLEGNTDEALKNVLSHGPESMELITHVRNQLLPSTRRWRESLEYTLDELLNVERVLKEIASKMKTQPMERKHEEMASAMVENFLTINIRPFKDENYQTRVANLLKRDQDPVLQEMFEGLRLSDYPSWAALYFRDLAREHSTRVIIRADDRKEFHFQVRVIDADLPAKRADQTERALPRKEVEIELPQRKAYLNLEINYEVEKTADKKTTARAFMDYGFYGKPGGGMLPGVRAVAIEVSEDISDHYQGVGRTMMGLAMAIAVQSGASEFTVAHVRDQAVDFLENLYPDEKNPERKFTFGGRWREGLEFGSWYSLDLSKVTLLPKIEIKKRTREKLSVEEARERFIEARQKALSLEPDYGATISKEWHMQETESTPDPIRKLIKADRVFTGAAKDLIRAVIDSGITNPDEIRDKIKEELRGLSPREVNYFSHQIERITKEKTGE